MQKFDVIIIGSGPGGYVAAIRCAQLGMNTAIVEKESTLGGTCLNVGCITSKALLDSSHHYETIMHDSQEHGIHIQGGVSLDFKAMIDRKQSVVDQTVKGIDFLMDKNKITVLRGVGSFKDAKTLTVKDDQKEATYTADKFIVATGSKPGNLSFISLDKERIITSTEALALKEIPKHLVVIGGGVIGLELGQVYKRLGAEVSVVEYADRIISSMDAALSKELMKVLKKQGIQFYLSHAVRKVERKGNQVVIEALSKKEELLQLEGDYALVSVGRVANTEGLGLENTGIQLDERGRIAVNEQLQTAEPHIYAIGDVIQGAMLAHKAEEEGVFIAEIIAGQKPHINYNLIPSVVYTWPEVASVGQTEEQLKAAGIDYKSGSFPMRALGRSRASGDIHGFIKILADSKTDEVLGVHMIGARCADLIAEAVTAMEFRASAEDIARMSHAHPTYAEAVKEAALAATENRALHA